MPQSNDLSRFQIALEQDSTLIAVVEMSQVSRLAAATVPGGDRHPLGIVAGASRPEAATFMEACGCSSIR